MVIANATDVLDSLVESGMLRKVDFYDCEGIAELNETTWDRIGYALSIVYPRSTVFPLDYGVTVQQGSTTVMRLSTQQRFDESAKLSMAVEDITGRWCPVSKTAACRRLLKWAGVKDSRNTQRAQCLLTSIEWQSGYFDCNSSAGNMATMYDMTSAYFTLTSRVPSPIVRVHPHEHLQFIPQPAEYRERWQHLLQTIAPDKEAGRLLWGVSIGSAVGDGVKIWRNGVKKRLRIPGHAETLATVVARSAWELTRAASIENGSLYSQTDCVILPESPGKPPRVWEEHGIQSSVKGSGAYHVLCRNFTKVGDRATKPYKKWLVLDTLTRDERKMYYRVPEYVLPANPPEQEIFRQYLN